MAGGDDALRVDALAERAGEHLVERKAQIARAFDGFAFLRCVLQSADEAERVAEPEVAVAAHVLQVQAGDAVARPMLAEVAVAAARAADAVREDDERHARSLVFGQYRRTGTARWRVASAHSNSIVSNGGVSSAHARSDDSADAASTAALKTRRFMPRPPAHAPESARRQRAANHCTMSST